MNFFDDGCANGGFMLSRREICTRISELYKKIDEEKEKKEALNLALARVDRAIERFTELLHDME